MADAPRILLSRQISFSAGLRLRHPHWDEETNRRIYGRSIQPHGAEFCLRVALRGPVGIDDGMIVNSIDVKPRLSSAVASIEDKFLDEDVFYFKENRPTSENIARYLWQELPATIGFGTLHRLQLDQSTGLGVEIVAGDLAPNFMKASRSYEFAAAHRLYSASLSDEENWARFDKCSNRAGHGHNFQLCVWVEGIPDDETGFVINPRLLDSIVDEEIYARFDHRHLNEDCPEFTESGLVPTSENLALTIFNLLQQRLEKENYKLSRIGLQETQKNYFEVEA